jgi:hypothetical protein
MENKISVPLCKKTHLNVIPLNAAFNNVHFKSPRGNIISSYIDETKKSLLKFRNK